MSTSRAHALSLIDGGYIALPVPSGEKGCKLPGWQDFSGEDARARWEAAGERPMNVGLRLDGLVDIDLDCPEAVQIAPQFLPDTGLIIGRESARRSHWIYRCEGGASHKLTDPASPNAARATYVEYRTGSGHQTVVAGIHTSGEVIGPEGGEFGEPADVDAATLQRALFLIGVTAHIARQYPGNNERHDFRVAGSAVLMHSLKLDESMARKVLEVAGNVAGDPDPADIAKAIGSTAKRLADGEAVATQPFKKTHITALVRWGRDLGVIGDSQRGANALLGIADSLIDELFCTPEGQPYAKRRDNGEAVAVLSQDFADLVTVAYNTANPGTAPSKQSISDVQNFVAAKARVQGMRKPVWLRAAREGDANTIRLRPGRYVVITRYKVELTDTSPHLFRSVAGVRDLPDPDVTVDPAKALAVLQELLGLGDDDFRLVVGFLIAAHVPGLQKFVLMLNGPQGSGKSVKAQMLRRILDPREVELQGPPKSESDFFATLAQSPMAVLDNVSFIPSWLSDAICRASTGGGFVARKLYSDADVHQIQGTWPVIITSIPEVGQHGDLVQRTLGVEVPRITAADRLDERTLWRRFNEALPGFLGALYQGLSTAIRGLDHVVIDSKPRMLDATTWVEAAAPAFGWPRGAFVAALEEGQTRTQADVLRSTDFGRALVTFIQNDTHKGQWEGTATDLHKALPQPYGVKRWPADARAVSSAINRLTPGIEAVGGSVERIRDGNERSLIISIPLENDARPGDPSTAPAQASNVVDFGDPSEKRRWATP